MIPTLAFPMSPTKSTCCYKWAIHVQAGGNHPHNEMTADHQRQTHRVPARRILVVDDDPGIRTLNALTLSALGYHVDAAEDGAAAWETLQRNRYELLITDHDMPKLTGVGLLKKVRSAGMNMPAILVSGMLPTEELNQDTRLQLEATLHKPYSTAELLGTVTEVLRTSDAAQSQNVSPSLKGQNA
jgi:DNA-binding response OmpR family regulator